MWCVYKRRGFLVAGTSTSLLQLSFSFSGLCTPEPKKGQACLCLDPSDHLLDLPSTPDHRLPRVCSASILSRCLSRDQLTRLLETVLPLKHDYQEKKRAKSHSHHNAPKFEFNPTKQTILDHRFVTDYKIRSNDRKNRLRRENQTCNGVGEVDGSWMNETTLNTATTRRRKSQDTSEDFWLLPADFPLVFLAT